ncbi:DUF1236 domain-containing protein [Methylobacterium sp. NEAU K]|uniref:DUF1236 domain-containing protein n=1 Tax=Methylobacterium sp. NEAU K TaxID=3064946 RepID=UPI00351F2D2D
MRSPGGAEAPGRQGGAPGGAADRVGGADRGAPGERPGAADRGGRENGQAEQQRGAPGEKPGAADRGGRENGQAEQKRGGPGEAGPGQRGDRGAAGERGGREGARGARGGGSARGAVTRLDTRQRTEFRSSITHLGVSPLRDVAFGLAVGTAIPRSVTLHRLPREIIEIVPEYEGYEFILVRDDIVIIDPDTYEIVDVIPA